MKIKNLIGLMAATVFMMGAFAGCGANSVESASSAASKNGISVVTTIFPEYDWVKEIAGDATGVEVTNLLDSGADLHNYQPTAEDIKTISTCDLFIYVGGESDEWAEDAIKTSVNPNQKVINLMDVLKDSIKEEEVVEGMQAEEEEEAEGEEEVEYDEHVWLSLKNTAILVNEISEAISKADAKNADEYKKNTDAYLASLSKLDSEYADAVAGAKAKTVLFGDRFPFRYMVDDYGLSYYAAFVGCSAETEASFETITFLAGKVDELSLPAVLTIEGPEHKIAETVVQNTASKDQKILTMDSMQSVTSKDVENGASYLKIMEDNLSVLKEALN